MKKTSGETDLHGLEPDNSVSTGIKRHGQDVLFSPECPNRPWDPPSLPFNASFTQGIAAEGEADHSPPSSTELVNESI
jgi:hypothetical protein